MTLGIVPRIPVEGYCHALLSFGLGEPNLTPITGIFEFGFALQLICEDKGQITLSSHLHSGVAHLTQCIFACSISSVVFANLFVLCHWYENKPHNNGPSPKTVNISPPHSGGLQAFFAVKTIFLQTSDCAGVFQSKHVARYIEKHSENNFLKQINSPTLELYAHSDLCHHKSHSMFH